MRSDDVGRQLVALEQQLAPLQPKFAELLVGTDQTAERICRSIVFQAEQTPKLLECTRPSLIRSAYTGAILGLPADGITGQGFLVPFRRKNVGQIAQWITGYKGYVTLGARAGLTIDGGVVREGDEFDFAEGTRAFVHHKKKLGGGIGRRLIAAYATASAPGRNPIVRVLDLDEIMAVKQKSAAARRDATEGEDEAFSPWNDQAVGFPAMAEKTAKRRLARSLPLLTMDFMRFHMAARIDEAHEEQGKAAWAGPEAMRGEPGIVIEGKAEPLVGDTQPPNPRGVATEELQRPSFTIKGPRGDVKVPTIEQWRARMMEGLTESGFDAAMALWDRNGAIIDEYRDEHPEVVRAVARVYEERRSKGR